MPYPTITSKERYAVSNNNVTKLFSQESSTINSPKSCAMGPGLLAKAVEARSLTFSASMPI